MSTHTRRPPSESQHLARARTALSRVRHLADLAPAAKDALARVATPRHYPAGKVIYVAGDAAETVYILERGWVKATRTSPEGREQAMLFLRSGEVFGDVAVLTDKAYPCTVAALEPVDAWAIDKAVITGLIAQYPDLAMAVIRRLGERVLHYVALVEDLSLRSVEARLARTLLENAEVAGDRLVVPRQTWTTFDEMATRLGTVRDVLSRALKAMEDEGLLRVDRREIDILDPAGLAARGNR